MFNFFKKKDVKKDSIRSELDIKNFNSSYFIVFQNKTYFEEKTGGYLWAPQRTKSGREIFHWSNMKKIKVIYTRQEKN